MRHKKVFIGLPLAGAVLLNLLFLTSCGGEDQAGIDALVDVGEEKSRLDDIVKISDEEGLPNARPTLEINGIDYGESAALHAWVPKTEEVGADWGDDYLYFAFSAHDDEILSRFDPGSPHAIKIMLPKSPLKEGAIFKAEELSWWYSSGRPSGRSAARPPSTPEDIIGTVTIKEVSFYDEKEDQWCVNEPVGYIVGSVEMEGTFEDDFLLPNGCAREVREQHLVFSGDFVIEIQPSIYCIVD